MESSGVELRNITPIMRVFDERKAKEFYLDFLPFELDWEHRFEADFPLYMQISYAGCLIHLSEHHGDCSPGSAIRIEVRNVKQLHKGLLEKGYAYARPGLEEAPWGDIEMTVTDPFHNRLVFFERSI